MLELLVNTSARDEKYLVLQRENLTIPIQKQISDKEKTFSQFCGAVLKSILNFKHFERQDGTHWFYIFEVTHSQNVV